MINLFLLLFISLFHAEECTDQWTKRASSLVQVKLQETAPELYTPVSVIFTPNVPVPDNLTDILLIPSTFLGQDPTTCIKQECQNTIKWDMVFFTERTQRHMQRDSSLDVLKCGDEVSECRANSIPISAFPLIPSFTPTFRPSDAPSVNPSEGPSVHPTLAPSFQPSTTPSASPSLFYPSHAPTRFPIVKMHLKVNEEVLWKSRNVHLLKSIFSSLYEVPVETIQLKDVRQTDEMYGGVDVELEVRTHVYAPIEVKFEDQVYITDRLKETTNIVLENDGFNIISLETLKAWKGFGELSDMICSSVTESQNDRIQYKTRKVGDKWIVTLEVNLDERLKMALELGANDIREDDDMKNSAAVVKPKSYYTFVLNLGISKSELNTLKRINRLKNALSSLLKGIYSTDITIKKIEESRDVGVSRIHLEISTSENVENFDLNHEDEVFLVESTVSEGSRTTTTIDIPLIILLSLVLVFISIPTIYYAFFHVQKNQFKAVDIDDMFGEQPGLVNYSMGNRDLHGCFIPVSQPGELSNNSSDSEVSENSCEEGKNRGNETPRGGEKKLKRKNVKHIYARQIMVNSSEEGSSSPSSCASLIIGHNSSNSSIVSNASSINPHIIKRNSSNLLRRSSSRSDTRGMYSIEDEEPSIVISSVIIDDTLTDDEEENEAKEKKQNEKDEKKKKMLKNSHTEKQIT